MDHGYYSLPPSLPPLITHPAKGIIKIDPAWGGMTCTWWPSWFSSGALRQRSVRIHHSWSLLLLFICIDEFWQPCIMINGLGRLGAAGIGTSDGQINRTTDGILVNSTAIGESKRNAIFCSLKACTGNGGELYKCYCCVKPGLTCFPSADDCEFYCHWRWPGLRTYPKLACVQKRCKDRPVRTSVRTIWGDRCTDA